VDPRDGLDALVKRQKIISSNPKAGLKNITFWNSGEFDHFCMVLLFTAFI
jgi:hypothetical protein